MRNDDKLMYQLFAPPPSMRWRRRRAVRLLARNGSTAAVQALARACDSEPDPSVAEQACAALSRMTDQDRIDAICRVWHDGASRKRLESVVTRNGWIASGPPDVRVSTALNLNRLDVFSDADAAVIDELIIRADRADDRWQDRAVQALHSLRSPDARAAMCAAALSRQDTVALAIAVQEDYAGNSPLRAALLFLAGDFDRYTALDFDGSLLHSFNESAGPQVRDRIARTARESGQLAWIQAAVRHERSVVELSAEEWETTVALLVGGRRWAQLWRLVFQAPALWGVRIVRALGAGRWRPAVASEAAFLDALAHRAGQCRSPEPDSGSIPPLQSPYSVTEVVISTDGMLCGRVDRDWEFFWLPDGRPAGTIDVPVRGESPVLVPLSGGKGRYQVAVARRLFNEIRIGAVQETSALDVLALDLPDFFDGHMLTQDGRLCAGKTLGENGDDQAICVWQLPSGRQICTKDFLVRPPRKAVVGISATGTFLAAVNDVLHVGLWRLPSGETIDAWPKMPSETGDPGCIAVSSDGEWVAAGMGYEPELWLGRSSTSEWHRVDYPMPPVRELAIAPDSRFLVVRTEDGIEQFRLPSLRHAGAIGGKIDSMTPDARFAVGVEDRTTYRYQPRLIGEITTPLTEFDLSVLEDFWMLLPESTADEKCWGEFIAAILLWRRRHDIAVDAVTPGPEATDIELEGDAT
ncbi:MAG TPA: HEAT repeat domain-containing protein [Mycobacteriales bacterium]|nr:HEAT repeat domain-containing protein [Mycobacteriales bacterium]